MISNKINAAVFLSANVSLHLLLGWLLIKTDTTIGSMIVVLFSIKKLAQAIYTYNEIKERSEQITNLFNKMKEREIDVDNVIQLKRED